VLEKKSAVMVHLLLGADRSLASAGVLLAASLEAVAADLEESGAGTACAISGSGSGRSDLDLESLGIGAPGAGTGVALAAAAEAVGAALEETASGRADGRVGLTLSNGGRADGLSLAAGIGLAATAEAVGAALEEASARSTNSRVSLALGDGRRADRLGLAAGIRLAASTETVRAALEEASTGRADSGIGVTLGVLGRADGSLARAGVKLAAATEAVGADLEESCVRGTLSIGENSCVGHLSLHGLVFPGLVLGVLVLGLGLGIGADTSGTSASISLAAAAETIGAVLEEASARSTDSVVGALGVLGRADRLLRAAGIELAAALEAIGADLEESCVRGTLSLGEDSCVRRHLLCDHGLRHLALGGLSDKDRIAGLLHEVGTPLLVARVVGAPSTETVVGADEELAYTLALSLLGSRACRGKASDGNESKDSGMHIECLLILIWGRSSKVDSVVWKIKRQKLADD
jgi:hypothetical protein